MKPIAPLFLCLTLLPACNRLPRDPDAVRARAAAVGVHSLTTDDVDLAGADLTTPPDLVTPRDLAMPPDLLPTQVPLQLPRNGVCLRQPWFLFSDGTVRQANVGDIWFDACRNYYCTLSAGQCAPKTYTVIYANVGCSTPYQLVAGAADDGLGANPVIGGAAKFLGSDGRWFTRGSATTIATGTTVYQRVGDACNAFKYAPYGSYVVFNAALSTAPPSGPVTYAPTFTMTP